MVSTPPSESGPFVFLQKKLRGVLVSFSQSIWKTAMESSDIRASYYKTLYDQSIAGVRQYAKGKLLDIAGGDLMNTLHACSVK